MSENAVQELAPRVRLLQKMRQFREALISECDWSADGTMRIQGTVIKYISIAQIKAALAPLFYKIGLELEATIPAPPTYLPDTRQYLVGVEFVWIDTDTGESTSSVFYGAATGDKGVVVAESYALKMYLTTKFCLADGIDPDKDGTVSSSFIPKTEKEKEEVTSKVLAKGVKPEEPKPQPKPAEKPKAEEGSITEPAPVKKADPAPAAEAVPEKVAVAPSATPKAAPAGDIPVKPVSSMQLRTIQKVVERLEESLARGEVDADYVREVKAASEACASAEDAREFITKYRS